MTTLRGTGLLVSVLALETACGSGYGGGQDYPHTPVELHNDVFTSGSTPTFVAGFVAGEAAAATLGPVPAGYSIGKVRFVFGGSTAAETVTVRVYDEAGVAGGDPALFTGDFSLTGSDSAMQEVAIDPPVAGHTTVRVAVFFQHSGVPSVAHDDGTTVAGRSWVFVSPGGWQPWPGSGNLVIRAVAE